MDYNRALGYLSFDATVFTKNRLRLLGHFIWWTAR